MEMLYKFMNHTSTAYVEEKLANSTSPSTKNRRVVTFPTTNILLVSPSKPSVVVSGSPATRTWKGRPKTDSHLNEASNEYSEEEIKAFGHFLGWYQAKKGRLAMDNVSCSSSSLAAVYSTRGTPPHLMRKYSR